jgi:hypothetical protein
MGFEKWIYRNGPGSPGHTARTLVKWYHNLIHTNVGGIDEDEIYFAIYMERIKWQEKLNNRKCLLQPFLEKIGTIISENDMPFFVFAIETLETKQFRNGVTERSIDVILEVIRKEVEKIDKSLIKLEFNDYRNKAISFFNTVSRYDNLL